MLIPGLTQDLLDTLRVLVYVAEKNNVQPTQKEIAAEFGVSVMCITHRLNRLKELGLINHQKKKPRSASITSLGTMALKRGRAERKGVRHD